MRVYFHEFITSGALSGLPLPPSLLQEGQAMRSAVAADLLAIGGIEVVSTRDPRVPGLDQSRLTEWTVSDTEAEASRFRSLCAESHHVLIIAPEIDGELQRRVALADDIAGRFRVWNSLSLIATASDKWETFVRLRRHGIPTIETCLGASRDWTAWDRPVVKPRDGAGSQDIRRLEAGRPARFALDERVIVQPFIQGRWLSCTILFLPDGGHTLFPPAEQRIADDGRFTYLGGAMPARCDTDRVQALATEAVEAVTDDRSGLVGPVGVDLVEDDRTGELLVCEINPRFTTSYVAARKLSATNLLAPLVHPDADPPVWSPKRAEFDASGQVLSCHHPAQA